MSIFVAATAGTRTPTGSMQTTSTNALTTSATPYLYCDRYLGNEAIVLKFSLSNELIQRYKHKYNITISITKQKATIPRS